ncbi:protein LYRIC isoform 2-T2 [Discoglossus pictus]
MASAWQEAAAQQAEEMSARFRQLLIKGLALLRSELGLDLGLQPKLYPSWVFLAVPISLGLLVLLLLCTAGRGSGKKRPREEREQPAVVQPKAPVLNKVAKSEDPKKKPKKKPAEKAKPNGRPVELSEEEVTPTVKKDIVKQPLDDKKNEKAKKNKKKQKGDAKQTSPTQDKKEAEEGNWETKVSNREKRQQRKRDKGTESDSVPFVETTNSIISEPFISVTTQSTGVRKSKGSSDISTVNGSGWNEKQSKPLSSQFVEEKWTSSSSIGKKKPEPCTWNQDTADTNGKEWSAPWSERPIFPTISAWSSVDGRMSAPEPRPSFTTIGLNSTLSASVSDPITQSSVPDNQWDAVPSEPCIDDEWSGSNGVTTADSTSDWKAPAEEWGNYGEEEPVPAPQLDEPEQEVQKVNEKEKEEAATAGTTTSKTKKKKKKKKKQGEESGSPTQDAEGIDKEASDEFKEEPIQVRPQPERVIPVVVGKTSETKVIKSELETRQHAVFTETSVSLIHSISEKGPSQVQQPQETSTSNTKQNSVPAPSQAKSEESWESPKQVQKKKKKARRET